MLEPPHGARPMPGGRASSWPPIGVHAISGPIGADRRAAVKARPPARIVPHAGRFGRVQSSRSPSPDRRPEPAPPRDRAGTDRPLRPRGEDLGRERQVQPQRPEVGRSGLSIQDIEMLRLAPEDGPVPVHHGPPGEWLRSITPKRATRSGSAVASPISPATLRDRSLRVFGRSDPTASSSDATR
jgi:hypothetical protein